MSRTFRFKPRTKADRKRQTVSRLKSREYRYARSLKRDPIQGIYRTI